MAFGGMDGERPPATADIEDTLAGLISSLRQTSSRLSSWASSRVVAPREKTAQLYVIDGAEEQPEESFETS